MRRRLVVAACLLFAAPARAEDLFPVQADFQLEGAVGSNTMTSAIYFSVSYAHELVKLSPNWRLFGGVGFADQYLMYWKRSNRRAPDAITGINAPGIEGRIGIVRGTDLGAPRFVVKVTPMYARSTTEMDLPGDRGLGMRASAGVAWPAWLLGGIEPDPPGTKSYEQTSTLTTIFAAIVPSELEYVFQYVPGDVRHGIAFGWSI